MLRSTATMEGLAEYLSWSSTNLVNISSGRKPEYPDFSGYWPTTFGRALTNSSHMSVASPNRDSNPRSQRWKALALTIAPPKPLPKHPVSHTIIYCQFLETMQYKYDSQARESKIFVVGTCGFDSIPADMGIVYTQKKFPGRKAFSRQRVQN